MRLADHTGARGSVDSAASEEAPVFLPLRWIVVVLFLCAPRLARSGSDSVPGLHALFEAAQNRHAQLEQRASRLELQTQRPPEFDVQAWRRSVDMERRRLGHLRERSRRVLARYSGRLQTPPSPAKPGMLDGVKRFFGGVKNDVFDRRFDWRSMLAMGGGGALGFLLGSRFLGPKGGMIGAAVGAIAAERLASWLIDRRAKKKLKKADAYVVGAPRAPIAPPLPAPQRVAPRSVDPARDRASLAEHYRLLRDSASRRTADLAGRFEAYRSAEGDLRTLRALAR